MANIDWAPFICDDCGRQLKYKWVLAKHMRNIHCDFHTFTCDPCSKEFNRKEYLVQHILSVHQHIISYKCNLCADEYKSKQSLQHHQANIHQGVKFECDDCGKLCGKKGNLPIHIKSFHQQLRQLECLLCGAKFSRSSDLLCHAAVKHNRKQLQCDDCGAKEGCKPHLSAHSLAVHLKLHRFKCAQCPAEFRYHSQLKQHIRVIHKHEVFVCDICSKTITQKPKLAIHCFVVHMCLRIFACPVCAEMFPRRGSLSHHGKTHH